MIGPGVVGHWVAPGERDVPDPDEYLKVPAKSARLKNGQAEFSFYGADGRNSLSGQGEIVGDRSSGECRSKCQRAICQRTAISRISRDRYAEMARVPVGATDDQGRNVLPLMAKKDRKYVTQFEGLPFTGFAKLHWIELDLGNWDASKPLRF